MSNHEFKTIPFRSKWISKEFKIPKFIIFFAFASAMLLASCSKKPAELYNDGMKSFVAGKYQDAQEDFAKGIKKDGSDTLYAGFIAANLVTGKYTQINQTYNDLSEAIHDSLVALFGEKAMKFYGATTELIPYKIDGGNRLPQDFPQTIVLQSVADRQGFFTIKQQIDKIIKK